MIELRLPSFGADMDDAEFVQWTVQPGQRVAKGDIACVVETQKGAIDVEVWQDGVVARLLAEPGQRLPVGRVLALLAEGDEDWQAVASAAPTPGAATPAPQTVEPAATAAAPAAAQPSPRARISPAARRRAAELGVDLQFLADAAGAQPVTLADVERVAAAGPSAPSAGSAEAMRAAIGAAMARSKREIPHYYLGCEIEVEAALRWLEAFNAARGLRDRVLWVALALRAIGLALREAPQLNGRFVDGRFEPCGVVHLGVVTALRGGGLVVPTVHDADHRPLPEVMRALADALSRARAGRLRSSDLADATTTVTHLGDLGTDTVYGVIYPPQVALVGMGRIAPRPMVRDNQLVVARTVHVTLAADHRVSDGMIGARFLGDLARRLAHPEELA